MLNIHGGPYSQYDGRSSTRPRSTPRRVRRPDVQPPRLGRLRPSTRRAIRHALGSVDADDVLAFLDHALADDSLPLDRERQGVMGGSYGGYMTALLTTRTDRFAAAVVERGYLDATSSSAPPTSAGSSPASTTARPEAMLAQSPMTHVGEVSTPTLVIHSEADWRCPVEQGQRWFTALKVPRRPDRAAAVPGRGPRAQPQRPAPAPPAALRARPALVGRAPPRRLDPGPRPPPAGR